MDNILAIMKKLAQRVRAHRKNQKLSQQELSRQSGVSFGSVKRFERGGEISLKSLLRIAQTLEQTGDFDKLFAEPIETTTRTSPASSTTTQPNRLTIFKDKSIRSVFYDNDWWFCLTDIVAGLLRSKRPRHYLLDLRRRDHSLARIWPTLVKLLPLETPQGKHKLLCINTLGFFRLIQSMPNKQVEHWRLWLAQTAYERICEIENPARAIQRVKEIYRMKGLSEQQIVQKISEVLAQKTSDIETTESGEKEFAHFTAELNKLIQPVWH